jgi:gliding motility-associated lipoprotein GldH
LQKHIFLKKQLLLFTGLCFFLVCCTTGNLYEKAVPIPQHQWKSSFKPRFSFNITDTATPYRLYVIFRHSEKYNYNNIWLRLGIQSPDSTRMSAAQYELPLATNERGWLAQGMDDVYEHRIALTPASGDFYFQKPGTYTFQIEQLMREDPLMEAFNIGLRVEKKL